MSMNIRQSNDEETNFDEPDIKAETNKKMNFDMIIEIETEKPENNDTELIPEII